MTEHEFMKNMNEGKAEKGVVAWYYQPLVLVILASLIGFLAAPLIWRSPALKRSYKIVFIALLLGYTVLSLILPFMLIKIR